MVKRGALESRFDALYYKISTSLEIATKSIYPKKKLSEIAELQRGRFSHRPRNAPEFYGGEYPFIQTGDIVRAGNGNGEITFSQTLNDLGLSVSKIFSPNILVMTIAANIGDTAILTYSACFPDSLVTIKPKNDELNIHYLNIYFKFIKNYLNEIAPQTAQKNINLQQLSPVLITIPPLEIQTQIVEKFNQAYEIKRQKEAEAKALLASIDGYLLEQLGIKLPEKIETKPTFLTRFKDLQGKRFDPKNYLPQNQALYQILFQSKYDTKPLKALTIQSVAGEWGIDEAKEGFSERLVIRATEFDNLHNLNLENSRVKYRYINDLKLAKMDLQVGDLLIEKSGGSEDQPVGRIAIITEELAASYRLAYSNFIHKIRINEEVNSAFLFYFLKTIHNIKITDTMQSQTNGIRNLIMREFLNIPVSLPPLEVQTEIADHISQIRAQAKALETEARQVLATAKAEVERVILG